MENASSTLISARLLFATLTGVSYLVMGVIALVNGRRLRLNRLFGMYNVAMGMWNLTGFLLGFCPEAWRLIVYRLMQIWSPLSLFLLIGFLQELLNVYEAPASRLLRRGVAVFVIINAFLYCTSLLIQNVEVALPASIGIRRSVGPLHLFNLIFLAASYLYAAVVVFRRLRTASGLRRNQLRFVACALMAGNAAAVFYLLAFLKFDLPWTYYPLQGAMSFCFGYAKCNRETH